MTQDRVIHRRSQPCEIFKIHEQFFREKKVNKKIRNNLKM